MILKIKKNLNMLEGHTFFYMFKSIIKDYGKCSTINDNI